MNNKPETINFYKEIKNNNAYLIGLIENFLNVYEKRDDEIDIKEKLAPIIEYNKNIKISKKHSVDMDYEFEIRKRNVSTANRKSIKESKRIKVLNLKLDDFEIKASKKESQKTIYEFEYKQLKITDESIKYKVNVNFENDDHLKNVLLKTYHNTAETHFEMFFDNKYEGFFLGHNRNKDNDTLSKLKSYNIDLKKILIGDNNYLNSLGEQIEFEKLTEDFSKLESFIMNEHMFASFKFENLQIPEIKEEPSFFKKLRQKFGMK